MRLDMPARHAGLLSGVLLPLARSALADEDIRDLRAAKALPGTSPLILIAAAVLALLLIGYFLWRRRRRVHEPERSAAETALARLEAARALLVSSRAREFCDAVSDVVRQYIESQFALIAQQRTTEEFLQELSRLPATPLAAHRAALAEFLQRCDFVRFSGAAAGVDSLQALFDTARRFVLDTAGAPRDPLPAA